jgi:hypothetical protein
MRPPSQFEFETPGISNVNEIVLDNNAYINDAKDERDLRGCQSASGGVILVSNLNSKGRSPLPGNRIAFSARSAKNGDFLPDVAGDPGLALQTSNPKISFSNNHYNVQACE